MPATASSTERVTIRTAAEVGPAAMAEWINLFHWNPGPLGGAPLTAQDYAAFIRDRGAIETLLAMDGERIVGSLALYPVSAMKAGHGSVVWMDTFAIHPDYRLGTIPIRLFVAAFVLCVTRGYDRIDCNASPANPSMVAIVRPAGFKQASPQPCADDRLEFRSYLPFLYRFIAESLEPGEQVAATAAAWADPSSSPWTPGRTSARSAAEDAESHHGARVFRYPMVGSGTPSEFVVDIERDHVCAVRWATLEAGLHPSGPTRRARAGSPVEFEAVFANRGAEPLELDWRIRRVGADGDPARPEGSAALASGRETLKPGADLRTALTVTFDRPGEEELELELATTVEHAGAPHPATLRLRTWVRVEALSAAPVSIACGPAHRRPRIEDLGEAWVLANPWVRFCLDKVTGTATFESALGAGPVVRELWPDAGPPFPPAVKTPPPRAITLVAAEADGDRAALVLRSPANFWWTLHGGSYARRDPQAPDLGRLQLERTISLCSDQLVRIGTRILGPDLEPWHADLGATPRLRVHPWALGHSLTMAVPLADGVLRAPLVYERFPFGMHSLEMPGCADLPPEPKAYAETWTAFTDDGRSIAVLWQRAAQLRFGLRWMPSLVMDAEPDADGAVRFPDYALYCGPGDERAVRDAWLAEVALPQGLEVRPRAAVRPALAAPVPVRLTLAGAALRDAPADPAGSAGPVGAEIAGEIRVLSVRARTGRLTAAVGDGEPVVLFDGTVEGSGRAPFVGRVAVPADAGPILDVRAAWTEQHAVQHARRGVPAPRHDAVAVAVTEDREVWQLEAGRLCVTVAPDFGGAVVGLAYDGAELLATTFPRRRLMGIAGSARGGLNVSAARLRCEPTASIAEERFLWHAERAEPTEDFFDGLAWSGLRMTGPLRRDETAPALPFALEYLLSPDLPLLVVRTELGGGAGGAFEVCVAAHVDRALGWSAVGAREDGEFGYRPTAHGSNRPQAGSRRVGVLRSDQAALAVAGSDAAETVAQCDGEDWSLRILTSADPGRAAARRSASCWAVLDRPDAASLDALHRVAVAAV